MKANHASVFLKKTFKKTKLYRIEIFFSLLFSVILTLGYLLSKNSTIDAQPPNKSLIYTYFVGFLVYSSVIFFALFYLRQRLNNSSKTPKANNILAHLSDNKLWAVLSGAIFFCYLPVIIVSGSMLSPDSWNSINQATGMIPLNNAHPLIFTGFVSIFISIGKLFDNLYLGILLFATFQSLLLAIIFSRVIVWMRSLKISTPWLLLAFVFYAMLPINSFAGIIMWKDILFAGFGSVFLMLLRQFYIEPKKFMSYSKIALFMLFAFLFCVWRNNGLYAYALFLLLAPILNRGLFMSLGNITLLATPLILAILYLNLTGLPTSQTVKISVPLQQIARTVKYHSGSLSPEDKHALSEVLPYDRLSQLYNPNLSDPVMINFNEKKYIENKEEYHDTWFRILKNHKKTYVAAFIYNNFGYIYPLYSSPTTTDTLMNNTIHTGAIKGYRDVAYDNNGKHLSIEYRDFIMKPLPFLHNIGFYVCVAFLGAYIAIIRRHKELSGVYILLFCLLVTTMLSPVNGEFRYLYLFVVATPFILAASITRIRVSAK